MTAITEKRNSIVESGNSNPEPLLQEAIQGSQSAFRALVLAEHQNVRVYLARYIFCPEQVEDLAQEVFIAAYRQLSAFRGDSKFSTWLLGIARNLARDFLRREFRRQKYHQLLVEAKTTIENFKSLEREDDLEIHEARLTALRACLDQLPPHSRSLLNSFYFEQRPSSVIAESENRNDGAVRMKLCRIRKKLAVCILAKMSIDNFQNTGEP